MATWEATPGKIVADQAIRSALPFSVSSTKAWSLWLKLAPSLRAFRGDNSNALVSFTGSNRESNPILRSRSSPVKVMLAPGFRSILLAARTRSFGRKIVI